jgi:type VI secretion system ImpC/EvpB family protein
MREPYADGQGRVDGFCYREDTSGADGRNFLWGNAAYAFGAVVARAFAKTGWLADIRGVQRGVIGGGLVEGPAVDSFTTDKYGLVPKCTTEVMISEDQEKELGELGLLPLCDCKDTPYSAFYSVQSVQKPKKYHDRGATLNARISAMLQYILCVSRFAHFVKVLGRERVGAFTEASTLQAELQQWVRQYVTTDDSAGPVAKARKPLRKADVHVRATPGRPGHFECEMRFWPHFQLDELTATVMLATELAPVRE